MSTASHCDAVTSRGANIGSGRQFFQGGTCRSTHKSATATSRARYTVHGYSWHTLRVEDSGCNERPGAQARHGESLQLRELFGALCCGDRICEERIGVRVASHRQAPEQRAHAHQMEFVVCAEDPRGGENDRDGVEDCRELGNVVAGGFVR